MQLLTEGVLRNRSRFPVLADAGFISISLELPFLLSCPRKTVSPSVNTPKCLHRGEWSTSAFLTM